MKTRNILISLVLLLVMTLNACGTANSLLGAWKGSYDVTDMVKEIYTPALTASDEAMAEYIQLEGLSVDVIFTFTEDKVTISVDDAGKEQLRSSIESALLASYNAYIEAKAAEAKIKLEQLYTINRTTQEEAQADFLKDMKVEQVVEVVVGAFQVSGSYDYDDEAIVIVYEDNTWEKMKYAFEGEQLTIIISNGEKEFPVVCEKTE